MRRIFGDFKGSDIGFFENGRVWGISNVLLHLHRKESPGMVIIRLIIFVEKLTFDRNKKWPKCYEIKIIEPYYCCSQKGNLYINIAHRGGPRPFFSIMKVITCASLGVLSEAGENIKNKILLKCYLAE